MLEVVSEFREAELLYGGVAEFSVRKGVVFMLNNKVRDVSHSFVGHDKHLNFILVILMICFCSIHRYQVGEKCIRSLRFLI